MTNTGASIAEEARLGWRELLLVFAFWTVFALLTVVNRLLDPRGLPPLTSAVVVLPFVESYLWALLTPVIFWITSRFDPDRRQAAWRALLFVLVAVAAALLVDVIVELLRSRWFPPSPRRRGGGPFGVWTITRLRYLNDLMVAFAVLAAGVARDYFLRYRTRQAEAVRLQAEAARLEAQLAEARLAVLRSQLDPHFLFNTLHAVSALVERDPKGVRRMIARLSELLRSTLEGSAEQEIPLAREVDLLRRYLEIMQIRFQGRLETSIDLEPGAADALVPNLILQPIVENALKHGVGKSEGTGRVEVRARRVGEDLVLSVRDSVTGGVGAGAGASAGASAGAAGAEAGGAAVGSGDWGSGENSAGVGLRNTRERLEQLYGRQQRFALRREDGATVAEVVLPFHTRGDLRAAGVAAGA
ncbi:MAG TPA: histidine kinase [Gemmatimonadaceae bacterium]|nr:histidine kinase [Gemmatimonadaceae bacterium]